ncbi:hypothetical protein NGRA_2451 [Nosema granulosis]|uniref:Serpin domain-containing protein n=1 Tax=Nosema granulosis TaxID=83296 RepID=A0A9P6GX26_9MICR|nr:hypothetical protein NGRA_2451 [Nosema granulosis]
MYTTFICRFLSCLRYDLKSFETPKGKTIDIKSPQLYDIATISMYLKDSGDQISAFSPVAYEESLMLMASLGLLGEDALVEDTKKYLTDQKNSIYRLSINTFDIFHGIPEPSSISIPKRYEGFFQKIKKIPNRYDVFNEYLKWLKAIAKNQNLKSTEITILDQNEGEYVGQKDKKFEEIPTVEAAEEDTVSKFGNIKFESYSYFKDEWKNTLGSGELIWRDFTLKNGEVLKDYHFIKMTRLIKFKKFSLENIDFDMIAIGFDGKSYLNKRVMIYLIPKKYNCDLEKLWKVFSSYKKGNINLIVNKECLDKRLTFCVPMVHDLISDTKFESHYIKDETRKKLTFDMTTFVSIGKGGKISKKKRFNSMFARIISLFVCIKADKPHISFVYDLNPKRIPIFIKYTGVCKK